MKTRFAAAAFAVGLSAVSAHAEGVTHHIAFHVNQSDPHTMNMTLNNVQNLTNHYLAQGDTVVAEVVAYGPGLMMYMPDSPVAPRISHMALEYENLSFAACGNTMRKMAQKRGAPVTLLDEAQEVPSGVVRLVELQEEGYSYIRP